MSRRPVQAHQHGTLTGYVYGCRCARCAEAQRAYRVAYREHGTNGRRRGRPAGPREAVACLTCSATFVARSSRSRQYCSRACSAAAGAASLEYRADGSRQQRIRAAGGLTQREIWALLHEWRAEGRACEYCAGPCETTDHVVPLVRGGANELHNLVPACVVCNSSKGTKLLEEWEGPPHVRAA